MRRVINMNKKGYDKFQELINAGHNYIVWDGKKLSSFRGSEEYVKDQVNIKIEGVNKSRLDFSDPNRICKILNNEFRCFFVPAGFGSSDPSMAIRHLKLNITGV